MKGGFATRVGKHVLSNAVAYIALFCALGGTAYASVIISSNSQVAKNTISGHHPPAGDHANLVAGSINGNDLAAAAVTGTKLAAGAVDGSKVLDGSLTGTDIHGGSLPGTDIQSDSLTGSQINESTLGEVPAAKVGGYGRSTGDATCTPAGAAYEDCVILTLGLPAASRVLLIGQASALAGGDSGGTCKLVTQFGDVAGTEQAIELADGTGDSFATSGVTGVLGPGSVDFALDCAQGSGHLDFYHVGLTAVALSAD